MLVTFFFWIAVQGYSQDSSFEEYSEPNEALHAIILENGEMDHEAFDYRLEEDLKLYYKGLTLIDEAADSLVYKFFSQYIDRLSHMRLFKESNKLALRGIKLERDDQYLAAKSGFYSRLAQNYRNLKKYDSAIWAYKKVADLSLVLNNEAMQISIYNNLGFHYLQTQKKYDSALYYFNKRELYADSVVFKYASLNWSINDNIALVYMAQGKFVEARRLFEENYRYFTNNEKVLNRNERWIRSGLQWADAETKQGRLKKADSLLKEIENHFNSIPNYRSKPIQYFKSKLLMLKTKKEFASTTQNFKAADRLNEVYFQLKDSLETASILDSSEDLNVLQELGFLSAKNTLQQEFSLRAVEKQNLALESNRKSAKIYWFAALGILLAIISYGYFHFRKMRVQEEIKRKTQAEHSQNLIRTQEEERKRVARELQESVGQKLKLLTKRIKEKDDNQMDSLARSSLEEISSISKGLHPSNIEKLGVSKAIESLVNEIDANTSVFFKHEIDNIDHVLDAETALHVYRIIQEGLSNIVKHANAETALVKIERTNNGIKTTIKDNGRGFVLSGKSDAENSLGMRTLLERAKMIRSKLNIESEINKGTELQLIIPI